jgi:hypothetical protein
MCDLVIRVGLPAVESPTSLERRDNALGSTMWSPRLEGLMAHNQASPQNVR